MRGMPKKWGRRGLLISIIPYFAVLFAFHRQLKSGKYHPVVALLHNMVEEDFKEGFIRF
jgi:hypothetical protein